MNQQIECSIDMPVATRMRVALIFAVLLLITGCDVTREWDEEVQLHDGRKVVVHRTEINDRSWGNPEAGPYGVFRQGRIKFSKPPVEWRGDIAPIAADIRGNEVYVVIALGGGGQCLRYGNPNPPFVYFRSIDGSPWERVAAEQVPSTMKQNLLIYPWRPEIENLHEPLTLERKRKLNIGVDPQILKFDPLNKRRAPLC